MNPIKIKEDIYWVGGIDWELRNFHGYLTQRGSTYNAYLILDEKITLIDTVKHYLFEEMLERISQVVDPSKIDVLISNHVEMDHSGSLPKIIKYCPNADVYTSPNGLKGLKAHYMEDWNFRVVKTGDAVRLGKRTLTFVLTTMVHWPDNMVSYCPEEKIIFSNDAFGQHLASSQRFDDEYSLDIIMEEARKYYANIVLPYSSQVQKALEAVSSLDIETICPSHGLIWRSRIADIIGEYKKWSSNETDDLALIIYDTMWHSTEKMAYAIADAFEKKGYNLKMYNLRNTHISDIMTDIISAKYICVGSSTLNSNMLPTVASFLTYMKGLAPKNRIGFAFGSFGWGGQSVDHIDKTLQECGFETLPKKKIKYIPRDEELTELSNNIQKLV